MTRNFLSFACVFGLLTTVWISQAFSQEDGWDNWNDLGGFEDFPELDGNETVTPAPGETPQINLPVPTEGDAKKEIEAKKVESEASELKVDLPNKVPDIDIPTQTNSAPIPGEAPDPVSETVEVKAEPTKKSESKKAVEKKNTKSVIKNKSKAKKKVEKPKVKEVVLKTKEDKKKRVANQNRRHVEEDIKVNSKISDFLERDVDLEESYTKSPLEYTRTDYNYKTQPHQFFIDHRNEKNSHLPKTVYIKEYSQLMFSAIDKEDIGALRALVSNGADINSKIIATGYSTAMYAVKHGKIRALRYLITKGVNLNLADNTGKTPLHLAISEGKVNIFNILIASGADPFIKDNAGNYPVDYATDVLRGTFNTSIARVSQDKNKALVEFSGKGSVHAVSELLSSGAMIDSKDVMGETALMKAIRNRDLKMVRYLLGQGANPLIENKRGQDALQIAREVMAPQIYSIIDTVVIRAELESGVSRDVPEPAPAAGSLGALEQVGKERPVIELAPDHVHETKYRVEPAKRQLKPLKKEHVKHDENYLTAFDVMDKSGEEHKTFFESLMGDLGFEETADTTPEHYDSVQEIQPGLVKKTAKSTEYVPQEEGAGADNFIGSGAIDSMSRFFKAFSKDKSPVVSAEPPAVSNPTTAGGNLRKDFSATVDLIPDEIQ